MVRRQTRRMLRLNHGGLLRCCIATAMEWAGAAPDEAAPDGTFVRCAYETQITPDEPPQMIVDGGIIRWNSSGKKEAP